MADPFEPIKNIQALATVIDHASVQVFGYIMNNPDDPNIDNWRKLVRELDSVSAQLDTQAVRLFGTINDATMTALKNATIQAKDFIDQTTHIEHELKLISSILVLAGGILGGAAPKDLVAAARGIQVAVAAVGEAETA